MNMTIFTPIDLIVPVYKNLELLKECLNSLLKHIDEISNHSPRLLVFNDSPDDVDVAKYLADLRKQLITNHNPGVNFSVYTNKENLGFVKTVNKALTLSIRARRAAILINADTVTFKGTLKNLVNAAYSDPQIGFACPRSNNAALATLPHFPHPLSGISIGPEAAYHAWNLISDQLPVITYAPTAVGFYLLIKERVLYAFQKLDEIFGKGYEEENDFILRANKVGFQAAIINHSFAFHHGSASFRLVTESLDATKHKNLQIMAERNPEFLPLVRDYEFSPQFVAERLLSNLIPARGKYNIVFDLRRLWLTHNGTTIGIAVLIKSICDAGAGRFNFYALCSETAFNFHGLDAIDNLYLTQNIDSKYAVAINLSQPFDLDQINTLEKLAPLNIYGMLDIIALDCGYIRVQNEFKLERYWAHVFKYADGIFYISQFSRDSFLRRFSSFLTENIDQIHATLLMPTELLSYKRSKKPALADCRHILVMGNHFKHKGSIEAAKAISDNYGSLNIVCLAAESRIERNIQFLKSGEVPEDLMADYFSNASLVVLPSFYEGFGIGLVEALSYSLPVAVRNIPPVAEILATYHEYSGIYLYDTNEDLFDIIGQHSGETSHAVGGITSTNWGKDFCDFIDKVISKKNKYFNICERLSSSRYLNEYSQLNARLRAETEKSTIYNNRKAAHSLKQDLNDLFSLDSDEDFVRKIYELVLGRDVDPTGLYHYINQLKVRRHSRLQVLNDLLASPEMSLRGQHDNQVKSNKLLNIFRKQ